MARRAANSDASCVDAVLAHPGVTSVSLNHPLSRVVVAIDGPDFSLRDLCRMVDGRRKALRPDVKGASVHARSLPGDGVVLATRAVTVAVNAAGLGIALTGRAMRLPPVARRRLRRSWLVDYQPGLRRLLEDRIGGPATDTGADAGRSGRADPRAVADVVGGGAGHAVDESRRSPRGGPSWAQHEPELARHADQPRPHPAAGRGRSRPDRSSGTQVVSHCCRRSAPGRSARAPAIWPWPPPRCRSPPRRPPGPHPRHSPRPWAEDWPTSTRCCPCGRKACAGWTASTRSSSTPGCLCTDTLRVARVRGADERRAVRRAGTAPNSCWRKTACGPAGTRCPGYPGSRPNAGVEALILPAHDPLASAVVAEAHRTGAELISVDVDSLDELRPAFDEVRPVKSGTDSPSTTRSPPRWPICSSRAEPSPCCHRLAHKRFRRHA